MRDRCFAGAPCVLFAYHDMGYACMEALLELRGPIAALFTHRDDPGEEIWWRSCAELARRHAIPVYEAERLDDQSIRTVAALQPAIIYSCYYRSLLPVSLLKLAPLGAFNLHGSLLPHYRGRAPVNWVLVNGERETGVTLHHMVARADAGDIVAQRAIAIDDHDTALTLYRKLLPLAVQLVKEYHPLITSGRAPRRPQDLANGSYFGRRRPEDGRIDWSWPARRIFNLVRAVTHPYPGAFCKLGASKMLIWEARVCCANDRRGEPGAIVRVMAGGGIEVAAGDGSLLILRAQLEGGAERDAAQVLAEPGIAGVRKLD